MSYSEEIIDLLGVNAKTSRCFSRRRCKNPLLVNPGRGFSVWLVNPPRVFARRYFFAVGVNLRWCFFAAGLNPCGL